MLIEEEVGKVVLQRTLSQSSHSFASQSFRGFEESNFVYDEPVGTDGADEGNNVEADESCEFTYDLEQATRDLRVIQMTINDHILSFSARAPLVFVEIPTPITFPARSRHDSLNSGILRLNAADSKNTSILTHEINMANSMIFLSALPTVDLSDFVTIHKKLVERITDEFYRIDQAKFSEWHRQIGIAEGRGAASEVGASILDTGTHLLTMHTCPTHQILLLQRHISRPTIKRRTHL